ncbi:MAG: flagellar filament capping protein FliD, partial [Rhodocyclaceae bacterium]|nr:flagellar filament capping protein FliD [Rhodocyclaceae bacterium]
AINGDGETEGALATDSRARIAANEVTRSLDRSNSKALSAIGITTNQDGTLSLDKQKFEQALQSAPQQVSDTLSAAGQQVEQSTSRQLQNTSNVNRSIGTLNTQVRNLESQQANQQNLIEIMRRSTEQANNRLNAISASGIASYQKIFNL